MKFSNLHLTCSYNRCESELNTRHERISSFLRQTPYESGAVKTRAWPSHVMNHWHADSAMCNTAPYLSPDHQDSADRDGTGGNFGLYSRNLAAAGNLLDSIAKSGFDEDVICGLGRIEEVALANGE